MALSHKAQVASLYLCFYYAGSSIGGTAAGLFWSAYGWYGVVSMISVLLLTALIIVALLQSQPSSAGVLKQQ